MHGDNVPLVSVIVPVFDDRERLERCLDALAVQTYPNYEVIVVDNGSREPVADLDGRYDVRLAYEARPGSYAARNRGLSVAAGDVIAFTDSDCIPAPDWLEKGAARVLSAPSVGLVAGAIDVFARDPARPNMIEFHDLFRHLRQRHYLEQRRFGVTANILTRRDVLEDVGRFDDRFRSAGDLEWCRRVHAEGYELVYADDVRVAHGARRTVREFVRSRRRVTGGILMYEHTPDDPPKRGPVGGILVGLLPPVKTTREISAENGVRSLRQILAIGAVVWLGQLVDGLEGLRLALGGEPKR
jgi:glycosyltransferase involved in cell wall biosynthesis